MLTIDLPWPPTVLNPNNRSHWAKKAKARAKHRADCYHLTKSASRNVLFIDGNIPIKLQFFKPTKRSTDADNLLSACKGMIDGIAEALAINDKRFKPITVMLEDETAKNGLVRVTLG